MAKMIDAHCLIHKESHFFPQLKEQMEKEDVNFYLINNKDNIGEGRVKGFLSGTSPYPTFVDYDDLIQPGIFKKIENILISNNFDWCYTDEFLIDKDNKLIQPGWSSHSHLYPPQLLSFMETLPNQYCHHLVIFKREILTLSSIFIMLQLKELAECFLFKMLGGYPNVFHLKEVGYYWRQHEDNGFRKFLSYQVIEKMIKGDVKEEIKSQNDSLT